MSLRNRVRHLERWYDKQEEITRLHNVVNTLQEEIKTIKKFLNININYGYHIVENKKIVKKSMCM